MLRFWLPWSLGLAALAVTMVLGGPYDLEISRQLVDRPGFVSQFVHYGGEVPGWILIVGALALLIASRGQKHPKLMPYRPLGWAIITQALLLPLALTQLLKLLWGRVRFIHLDSDFSNFTQFFQPAGVGAGKSFPSGHVAMAVLGAVVPFFLWRRGKHKSAVLAAILVVAWGAFVSFGRIKAGSHYLTDTLFSFGLAFLAAPFVVTRLDPQK